MISSEVVILTRAELKEREAAAFQRGVKRGAFEATVPNAEFCDDRRCHYCRKHREWPK